ncbi:hypothetical protein [Nocardia sp. NPDC058666]|uniref:hypothetical protein n=1 Tax=unclassified Nocardia TaxID=2637762 RepID=UPI00366814C2
MPISFDVTGFESLSDPPPGQAAWNMPGTSDIVVLTYYDLVPDLPAPLHAGPALFRALAQGRSVDGCLIDAWVTTLDGQECLVRLEKFPLPGQPRGVLFGASIVVPKANCSAVVQIMCPETGTTGMREAMLTVRIGFANFYPPHPFDPGLRCKLPFNAADDRRYDVDFPDHPLTRARNWLDRTLASGRLNTDFAALPPFTGASPR